MVGEFSKGTYLVEVATEDAKEVIPYMLKVTTP
jgi:hypothetical protein